MAEEAQRAVIFDVDGVLVDSYQAHFESWRQTYEWLGHAYSEEDFAADFGRTSREILRRRFGPEVSDQTLREWDDRKEALYREIVARDFPAMDGAAELIDALHSAGFRLAIGSSGPPENVAVAIEGLGRQGSFVAMVTRTDVTRGKPDPQVFLIAAERLAVPPARCAVLEDAVHGVEAARRAGMASIGLVGTVTRDRLPADLVIDSLRELSPERIAAVIARNGT